MPRKPIKNERDTQFYRIFGILNALDAGRELQVAELAQKYGTDVRTIQRDFIAIRRCGYSIVSCGKGGKKFADGVHLRKTETTAEQQAAIITLHEISKGLGISSQLPIKELRDILASSAPDSRIVPLMPTRKAPVNPDPLILEGIKTAIEDRHKLDIKYLPPGQKQELERRIRPIRLLFFEGITYVLAVPDNNPDVLIKYRLDRITWHNFVGVEAPKRTYRDRQARSFSYALDAFEPPANIDELLEQSHSIWGIMREKDRKVRIKLKVTGWAIEYFQNQEIVPKQKVTLQKDGSLIFEAKIGHTMEIIPHILHWLPHVQVINPPALKAEIRAKITDYLKK